MDFISSSRAAKTGQNGKGLLQSHLLDPTALQGNGIEQNRIKSSAMTERSCKVIG